MKTKSVQKCSTRQSFNFPKWHSFKIGTLIILFFLGLTVRKEKEVEIQTKKAQLDEIHKEKEAKRLIKEEREKVETAALDVIREEEERHKQAREEKEKLEKEAEAIEYFKKLDR